MKKIFTLFICALFVGSASLLNAQDKKKSDFYEVDKIQELNISFEQKNWKYLLDSLRFNGDDLLIGSVDINGEKYEDVGIRYRGTKSFQPGGLRNGLTLILNFIKESQNYQGLSTLMLSSALRDPSMTREVVSYEIARNYLPAPRANYAKVNINKKYYGLFVNLEAVNDRFLKEHFGSSDGSFYKSNPDTENKAPEGCKSDIHGTLVYDNGGKCYLQNFENISDNGWDDLIELSRTLSMDAEEVDEVLDIDQTLWMHAFNNVLVNLSSYSGQYSPNYYLYKDAGGKFHPIIWDLNLTFGSFKNTGDGSDLHVPQLEELDPVLHSKNPSKPLISTLLKDDMYRKMYLSHMRTILYDHFVDSTFTKRAMALQKMIRKSLADDPNWFYNMQEFDASLKKMIGDKSKIPGLVSFMDERESFLRKHPTLAVIPPVVSEIDIVKREKFASERIKSFKITAKVEKYAKRVKIYYRFNDSGDFMEASMMDDGKSFDGEANDEVYGIDIDPPSGASRIEYYIFAENAKAVSYDPTNYMYERHSSSLTELNK